MVFVCLYDFLLLFYVVRIFEAKKKKSLEKSKTFQNRLEYREKYVSLWPNICPPMHAILLYIFFNTAEER